MQLEQELKNQVLEYLSYRQDIFVWPNDSVGIYDPVRKIFRKKNSRFHIRGVSDILGIHKHTGKIICIELKSARGIVSPEQKYFLDKINEMGGIGFVARSLTEVIEKLEAAIAIVDV